MKTPFWLHLIGIAAGACIATNTFATDAATETERQLLIRIAAEIEYVKALANTAQAASDPARRIQFNYADLISDLQEIQAAVERHADQPQRTPRAIPQIQKRYDQ
jgi:RAQPRD family integrative conjugative element protein